MVLVVVSLLIPREALAESALELHCQHTIEACAAVVVAEDTQIKHLQTSIATLEAKIEAQEPPLVPTWLALAGGLVGGMVFGLAIKH